MDSSPKSRNEVTKMWEDSPNTERILRYFSEKYSLGIAPIGLAKSLSVASLKVRNGTPLSIINVAPSGHFKTRLNVEQFNIFGKRNVVNFGSDFTIHGIARQYQKGKSISNKCCLINDLTLLFGSKSDKTKERLINGLAEILSEGSYRYDDFRDDFVITARISLVSNITIDSLEKQHREMVENTFAERCLMLYHIMSEAEESNFILNSDAKRKMCFGKPIVLRLGMVNYSGFVDRLEKIAEKWRVLTLSPSTTRTYDKVLAVALSNARLNNRDRLSEDDFTVLALLENYLYNPLNKRVEILKLHLQGLSQEDICKALGRNPENYQGYVSRIISDYRKRGIMRGDNKYA